VLKKTNGEAKRRARALGMSPHPTKATAAPHLSGSKTPSPQYSSSNGDSNTPEPVPLKRTLHNISTDDTMEVDALDTCTSLV
jgi:hypothetical protein